MKEKIENGKPWTDTEFPPKRTSLYNDLQDDMTGEELEFMDSLEWRRASDIYPNLRMSKGGEYRVHDITQG